MRRFTRLGVLLVGILSLLATSAPPASANTTKHVSFIGTLVLNDCPGLAHPNPEQIDPMPTLKSGPKNEPQANFRAQPNHCNFILGSTTCAKTSVGKKTGTEVCLLFVMGALWGNCLFFTGVGMLTLINASGEKSSLNYAVKLTGIDGLLFVSGGTKTDNVYGELKIVLVRGDCRNKTATEWAATGVFSFKTCTTATVAGLCALP